MAATISLALPRMRGWKGLRLVRLMTVLTAGFVAFLLMGNLVILGMTTWARHTTAQAQMAAPAGINNFRVVDSHVWRGAAPGTAGYAALAQAGVRTIVDLRAEEDVHVDIARLNRLGLRLVRIPIRDGQTPTQTEVDRFLAAVRNTSDGPVFVHCGAGVGRTGTMVAAYLVSTGLSPSSALRKNLSVGPPSLEQIAFAAELERGEVERPNGMLVALSRVLDAPRRTWARLSH
jgi:protein-tyrosine phosphatase